MFNLKTITHVTKFNINKERKYTIHNETKFNVRSGRKINRFNETKCNICSETKFNICNKMGDALLENYDYNDIQTNKNSLQVVNTT